MTPLRGSNRCARRAVVGRQHNSSRCIQYKGRPRGRPL